MTESHPDPAPITRHLRAMFGSRLLVAAVHHLSVFETLSHGPLTLTDLRTRLHLAERPAMVLLPALCAMNLLAWETPETLRLTELGNYLTQGPRHWSDGLPRSGKRRSRRG